MATSTTASVFSRRRLAKWCVLVLGAALCIHAETRPVRSAEPTSADLIECHPRAGWPNFLARAKTAGAEVKIGYLGGSITAQPGWRPKTLAYFQQTFPTAKFSEINAAIGGTGSDLGVFRLKQDVLDAKPDLLFVEFATNDGGAPVEQIHRCMEGIVRQTWRALPECDICFVYTLTEAASPELLKGRYQRSALAMEEVAEHYGIPTIHLGVEVSRLAQAGKLKWQAPLPKTDEEKQATGDSVAFANDGVHPYPETGHELYLQAIVRSVGPIDEASKKPGPHKLDAPLNAQNYEQAKLVSIEEATLSPGFELLDPTQNNPAKNFRSRLNKLYRGTKAGESISFKFKGTRAAIYDLLGPDAGQAIVTLDDQPPRVVSRFDRYCTYHRLGTLVIGSELPDAVHTVKIEIHPEQAKKAEILTDKEQLEKNPEKFDGTAIYPGGILVVGEIVK